MAEIHRLIAIFAILSAAVLSSSLISFRMTGAYASNVSVNGTRLSVWNETGTKYTYPTYSKDHQDVGCNYWKSNPTWWNVYFFANYSNSTSDPINNTNGNCSISFNETGSWTGWFNMVYNASQGFWQYNRSFTYKGNISRRTSCTSSTYDNLTLTDNVTITNSQPCIINRTAMGGGPIPNLMCSEDTPCYFYLDQNSIDDDLNDQLTYDHTSTGWDGQYHSLSADGQFTCLISTDSDPTNFNVTFTITDSDNSPDIAYMLINENLVNDAPQFVSLPSQATEDVPYVPYFYVINANDEESNTPFNFSINITGCVKAGWITGTWRNNCSLFSWNQTSGTSAEILSFTARNWDVGVYTVNYTVRDSGNTTTPHNATYYEIKNLTVVNVNDRPVIIPYNETNITISQNQQLFIIFNGTDVENDTLLFNTTTLLWNVSNSSYHSYKNSSLFPISTNMTYYPSESAHGVIDFVLTNSHVGNYTLNVTLSDNGINPANLTDYILVNLTVLNVNDFPDLENLTGNLTAIQGEPFYFDANASDPDQMTPYGDSLTFNFTFTENCSTVGGGDCNHFEQNSTFEINQTTGLIYIRAARNDTGNYTMNLTVTDAGGLKNWTLINLTIITDEAPVVYNIGPQSMAQNQSFWGVLNITDAENDTLNISYRTLYRNLSFLSYTLFYINVSNSTYPPLYNLTMNYSPVSNGQVGNYTLEINATDTWNRTTALYINLTVADINDPPQIANFTSCTNESLVYPLNMTLYENINYCLKLNRPDPDLYTPYGESLTYTFIEEECAAIGDLPPWEGSCIGGNYILQMSEIAEIAVLNFTPVNELWRGYYTFNLMVQDDGGLNATDRIYMLILPVNDPPVFVNLSSVLNATEDSPFYFQLNVTDEENNTPITFGAAILNNCSLMYGSSGCNLFTVNSTTGEFNFTANISRVGNYTINFTARDSGNVTQPYNATGWRLVTLQVGKKYHAPVIEWVEPQDGFYNATEGQNKTFQFRVYDILDNDSITCYWYLNGTLATGDPPVQNPVVNCNSTTVAFWNYPVSYDDGLNSTGGINQTLTLVAVDPQGLSANYSIDLTIFHVNRAPRFEINISSPIEWYTGSAITPIDLDDHFKEDAGESMQYSYVGASSMAVTIGSDGRVTLNPGNWYGTDIIYFIANDTLLTNVSNNVTLIVKYQPPQTRQVTTNTPTPRVLSLKIVVPEIITGEPGKASRATVILYNDGEYNLQNINLSAEISAANISLKLGKEFFPEILIGRNATTWLDIYVGDVDISKTYLIQLGAIAASPRLNETSTITLKLSPTNKTRVQVEIIAVKDLFEENPECMELFGLIVQAEQKLKQGDTQEAMRLTNLAMDNCRDMINYAKLKRNQTGTGSFSFEGQMLLNPIFVMGLAVAIIALAMLGFWLMTRRQPPPQPVV